MDKVFKVETVISQELAELYATLVKEFESQSSIPLSEINRVLLQIGLVHHLEMMMGLGLIRDEEVRGKIEELIEEVARDNIHWEMIKKARAHWRESGTEGQGGAVDIKA